MLNTLVNVEGREVSALAGRAREAVVSLLGSKYGEAAVRGEVFVATTDAAGVAPGTAHGTTAAIALENPLGSGVALAIIMATMGYHSGTIGAGYVSWVVDDDPASATPIATSTAITPLPGLVGSGMSARGKAHDAATLLNTPTPFRPAFSLDASLASSVIGREAVADIVDGEIVLLPGTVIALEGDAAAGSTPLVVYGIAWQEIKL